MGLGPSVLSLFHGMPVRFAHTLRPASEQELRNRRAWKVAHCVCMAPSLSRAIKSCERVDPFGKIPPKEIGIHGAHLLRKPDSKMAHGDGFFGKLRGIGFWCSSAADGS